MTTALHSALVTDVVTRHAASAGGWRRAVLGYLDRWEICEPVDVPRIIPDAWRIDVNPGDELDVIRVWEVEVTHPLPDYKLSEYGWLWGNLDASDVYATLDVWTIDRYGVERQIDLCAAYWRLILKADAPRQLP